MIMTTFSDSPGGSKFMSCEGLRQRLVAVQKPNGCWSTDRPQIFWMRSSVAELARSMRMLLVVLRLFTI
jgi:hypothetical protein